MPGTADHHRRRRQLEPHLVQRGVRAGGQTGAAPLPPARHRRGHGRGGGSTDAASLRSPTLHVRALDRGPVSDPQAAGPLPGAGARADAAAVGQAAAGALGGERARCSIGGSGDALTELAASRAAWWAAADEWWEWQGQRQGQGQGRQRLAGQEQGQGQREGQGQALSPGMTARRNQKKTKKTAASGEEVFVTMY